MTIASGSEEKIILPPLPPKRHSHTLPSAEDHARGTLAKCTTNDCERWFYRSTFTNLDGGGRPFPCWFKVSWYQFRKRAWIKQKAYNDD